MSADKDLLQYSVQGFDDPYRMEQEAKKASYIETLKITVSRPPENFDFNTFKNFHKILFKDAYTFAGVSRDEMGENFSHRNMLINDPSRPNHFQQFTPGDEIQSHADKIFSGLEKENNLKGLNQDQFADRLAHYIGEVNQLHPFREGNGRATKLFFSKLAENAGYSMDWRVVSADLQVQAFKSAAKSYVRVDGGAIEVPGSEDKTLLKKIMGQVVDKPERDPDRDNANAFRNHIVSPYGGTTMGIKYFPDLYPSALGLAEAKRHMKEQGLPAQSIDQVVEVMGEKLAQNLESGERLTEDQLTRSFDAARNETLDER